MKIVFKSEDFAELNFTRAYSEDFYVDEKSGFREFKDAFTYQGIDTKSHRIYCPGIIFSVLEGTFEEDLVQILESDFPYLQMHFELSSSGCLYYPQAKSEITTTIYKGTHSLLFYPALKGKLCYLKKQNASSVEIELSLDFLRRIFHNDLELLGEFGYNIERNLPAILGNKSYPVTPDMLNILLQIRECPYVGSIKKIFVEAKVMELLTLQIAQFNSESQQPLSLKNRDIDKLHEVRDLLIRHANDPYSIDELSKMVGINRTKLQEGFKELFGTTVFKYLSDHRLDAARNHIATGKYSSIAEVASIAGYKNPQHFTAAFKKKYGYLPKQIKESEFLYQTL